ncbi:MAG: ABC transporter substrate-binding protein [Caldilineaceae bacterium]
MRKIHWLPAAVLILALLFSGCAAPAPVSAPAAEPGTAETASTAPGDKEPVTLVFWHHWGGNRVPLMEEQIRRFEEKYPWITVEMTLQPWENRLQKILTSVAAGEPPDVTMLGRQDLPAFVEQGALMPIDDLMSAAGITADMFYEAEINGAIYNGQTYLLPLPTGGGISILWYNKDMFAEVGLDPESPPQTWAELEEAAKALTIMENGELQRVGINPRLNGLHAGISFLGWLHNNGGQWISDDMRTITWNSPEGLEALQWVVDFTNNINGGVEEVDAFYSQTGEWENGPFYTGYEAMQTNNAELFKILEFAPDMDFDIAPIPYGPQGDPAKRGFVYGGWGYVIPEGVEHVEEAWLLLEFLTADMDGGCWFLQEQQRPSPWIECNEQPESSADNPYWDGFLEVLGTDQVIPVSPVQPAIEEIVIQMQEEALFGVQTPEEALAWGAAEAQAVLDEFWAGKE